MILATDFSSEFDRWLHYVVETPPTIYDKAMDAVYNTTHIGGYHPIDYSTENIRSWGQ